MSMTDLNGRHRLSTLMRTGGVLAVAALLVAAMVAVAGCEQPGLDRPADPAADMSEVEQAGRELAAATVRRGDLGDDCDNNNKLTLCDTDNGSTWPESHGGDTFTVKLKFSKTVLVHPLVMRYSVFRVRNGRITSARAVGGDEVQLTVNQSRVLAKEWVLKVEPRAGHDVRLYYPRRNCTDRRAICTDKRRLTDTEIKPKRLDHRIRIDVPWEDPDPPVVVVQDPPSKRPGAVRNLRRSIGDVRWRAPATHGGAFITEYRIYRGGCESTHPHKVLRHPDDFWQHGGHNGFYGTYIGFRGSAGVRAVNRYGAGECEDTD